MGQGGAGFRRVGRSQTQSDPLKKGSGHPWAHRYHESLLQLVYIPRFLGRSFPLLINIQVLIAQSVNFSEEFRYFTLCLLFPLPLDLQAQ